MSILLKWRLVCMLLCLSSVTASLIAQVPRDRLQSESTTGTNSMAAGNVVLGIEAEERGLEQPFQIFVIAVRPGSLAESTGISVGDQILALDDREVGSIDEIAAIVRQKTWGDTLQLLISRQGERQTLSGQFVRPRPPENIAPRAVVPRVIPRPQPIGDEPTDPASAVDPYPTADQMATDPLSLQTNPPLQTVVERPIPGSGRLGVTVENAATTPAAAGVPVKRGAVVVAVAQDTPAENTGLNVGDVIVAIDGIVIRDAADLINEISRTKPGQRIELGVYKGKSLKKIQVTLADASKVDAMPARQQRAPTNTAPTNTWSERIGALFGGQPASAGNDAETPTDPLPPATFKFGPIGTGRAVPETILPGNILQAEIPGADRTSTDPRDSEIQSLKNEIELLQQKLQMLQQKLSELDKQ